MAAVWSFLCSAWDSFLLLPSTLSTLCLHHTVECIWYACSPASLGCVRGSKALHDCLACMSVVAVALQEHGVTSPCASASSGHAHASCNVIRRSSSPGVWCSVHLWNLSKNRGTAPCQRWQVKPPLTDVFPCPHDKMELCLGEPCVSSWCVLSAWLRWPLLFVAPDKSW